MLVIVVIDIGTPALSVCAGSAAKGRSPATAGLYRDSEIARLSCSIAAVIYRNSN